MANERINIMLPVGRLVGGSTTEPTTEDFNGNPLTIKTGATAGQTRVEYRLEVAIPKAGEGHWAETEWGKQIWAKGHADFPGGQAQRPDFSWKVTDGDSAVPNLKGNIPNQKAGYPGHWVLTLKSGYAPKTLNREGTAVIDPAIIKPGHAVQAYISVAGNGNLQGKSGVYLNHNFVAFTGHHPDGEIQFGADPATLGFGQNVPASVMAVPVGAVSAAQAAVHTPPVPTPGAPPAPPALPAAPAAPVALPPAPPAPPVVPVVPNAAMTAGVVAPPAPVALPPMPVAKQLLPSAAALGAGVTYESAIAAGWTDALLIQHGYMAG